MHVGQLDNRILWENWISMELLLLLYNTGLPFGDTSKQIDVTMSIIFVSTQYPQIRLGKMMANNLSETRYSYFDVMILWGTLKISCLLWGKMATRTTILNHRVRSSSSSSSCMDWLKNIWTQLCSRIIWARVMVDRRQGRLGCCCCCPWLLLRRVCALYAEKLFMWENVWKKEAEEEDGG